MAKMETRKMKRVVEKFCPACKEDITDSYDEDTKDYYCNECELPVPNEESDSK